jgi:hypothetical protein
VNNANIPLLPVKVRKEFLRNLEDGHGEFLNGYLFGVYAQRNQALLFHVFLETGAVYYRLPLNAFVDANKSSVEDDMKTSDVQLWDCLSNQIEVIQWGFLKDQTGIVNLNEINKQKGRYLFTIEFLQNDTNELDLGFINVPGEYKCAHILLMDNGYFCAMPNNRIVWQDQAFVKKNKIKHDYKINRNRFFAETDKTIQDEDLYFYTTDPLNIEHITDALNYSLQGIKK